MKKNYLLYCLIIIFCHTHYLFSAVSKKEHAIVEHSTQNSLYYLSKDTRNLITEYLLHDTTAYEKKFNNKKTQGLGEYVTYNEQQDYLWLKSVIAPKERRFQSIVDFICPMLYELAPVNKIWLTNGSLTGTCCDRGYGYIYHKEHFYLRKTRVSDSVIGCNVSLNETYMVYLIAQKDATYNIYKPLSLRIVNLKEKNAANKIEISLNNKNPGLPLYGQQDDWADSFKSIAINDTLKAKALIAKGYVSNSIDNQNTWFTNNVHAMAISSKGTHIAMADQTGIMLIFLDANTNQWHVKKIVTQAIEPIKSNVTLLFNRTSSTLLYKIQGTAIQTYPLYKEDTSCDLLEYYFRISGVCKKLPIFNSKE